MMKRLLSLLLTLAILLGAMPGLAETAVPVLHYADIASLKALAGDAQTGATWHEGMSPSASMNALQMWQWTDWFLSEKLRSLLGSAQDYIQLASGLSGSSPTAPSAPWNGNCARGKISLPIMKSSFRTGEWRFSTASASIRTSAPPPMTAPALMTA